MLKKLYNKFLKISQIMQWMIRINFRNNKFELYSETI